MAHVPVGDELHAVRIGKQVQENDVVQEAQGLRIIPTHHLVYLLDGGLRIGDFGGVQPTFDHHHGLAFLGQLPCFLVRQAFGEREPPGDFLVAGQFFVVLGRGDDGHQLRTALGRFPDLLEDHSR